MGVYDGLMVNQNLICYWRLISKKEISSYDLLCNSDCLDLGVCWFVIEVTNIKLWSWVFKNDCVVLGIFFNGSELWKENRIFNLDFVHKRWEICQTINLLNSKIAKP